MGKLNIDFSKINKKYLLIIVVAILFLVSILFILFFSNKEYSAETGYTVIFDSNGGTPVDDQIINANEYIVVPKDPVKDGYYFVGWYSNDELYDFQKEVTSDLKLVAKWNEINSDLKFYTVEFYTDGGSEIEGQLVSENGSMIVPNNPIRDGYTFAGWYYNEELYDFNSVVTTDIMLVAHWISNTGDVVYFKVSFDSDGAGAVPTQEVVENSIAEQPGTLTKKGYTFLGWYLDGEIYNFNSPVTKDIHLVAKWEKNESSGGGNNNNKITYKVSFNTDGAGSIPAQIVNSGGRAKKPTKPTKSGYEFVNWYLDGKVYDFNTPVKKNITLIAKWKKSSVVTYKVTFDSDGGTMVATQTILSGYTAYKPSDPKKEGYKFLGWYYNGSKFEFSTKVTKDINLVAKWEKNDSSGDTVWYTVSFDTDGGKPTVSGQPVVSGGYAQRPSTTPTKSGYIFDGWYLDDKLFDFEKTKIMRDIRLKAKWKSGSSEYTVSFVTKSSKTADFKRIVKNGEKVEEPDDPSVDGSTFIGWYTESKQKFNFNTAITSNITLTALYAPKINYKASTDNDDVGTFLYLGNPSSISANSMLADKGKGEVLLYKHTLKEDNWYEMYFSHNIGKDLKNKVYYGFRFYNANSTKVTISVSACGITTTKSEDSIWRDFYNNTCSSKMDYVIPGGKSGILLVNGDSLTLKIGNVSVSDVSKINGDIRGVMKFHVDGEIYMSELAFDTYSNTFYVDKVWNGPSYKGNITSGTETRFYSGYRTNLPVLTNSLRFNIYDATPTGYIPVSYDSNGGSVIISKETSEGGNIDTSKEWVTHAVGGNVTDSSKGTVTKYSNQYVNDIIALKVKTSDSATMDLCSYPKCKETRDIKYNGNGPSIKGWSFNWANWGVQYKEKFVVHNYSSSSKTVKMEVLSLEGSKLLVRDSDTKEIKVLSGNTNNDSVVVWTTTLKGNKEATFNKEFILLSGSPGVIVRRIILE